MAHFKRGYAATRAKTRPRLFTTPARWNIIHHSRPRRHENRRICLALERGLDPNLAVWPLEKRPHHYFW
jgi:hypothetical protein